MKECCFYIEINAPEELAGIETYIQDSQMNLEPYESGYNGKIILRSRIDEKEFEWSMDSSDSNILTATGEFYKSAPESKKMIESLSYIISLGGFPHEWRIDDEEGNLIYSGRFKPAPHE